MELLNEMVLTEKEFIELTIEMGFQGEELETATWKKRGCLKPNGTMEKLISKGLTHYFNIELVTNDEGEILTGKNRRYTLRGLKTSPTQRITGNSTNGAKPTQFDDIIKEYFFNLLSKRVAKRDEGWSETYNQWGTDWINQLIISDSEWASYHKQLKETFEEYSELDEDHIRKIYMNVQENLRKNQRGLAVKSIERLEKEKRIETEIEFFQAFAKGSMVVNIMTDMEDDNTKNEDRFKMHQKIHEYKHMEIVEGITNLLIPFGMTFGRYKVVSAFKHYGTEEEKAATEFVGKWLFEEHSIDYLYNRVRIFVTDAEIKMEISKEEAKDAYISRIIEKTNKRMNRKDYKATHKYQSTFYRLSVFLLLDMKKTEGLKEQIKMETKMIQETIDNCKYHYAVKYGENSIEEVEEVRWAFGEKAEKQTEKINIPVDFDDLFAPVEEVKPKVAREEIAWMNRFPITKSKKRIKPVATNAKRINNTQKMGTIDMNSIGLDKEKPKKKEYVAKIFGAENFVIMSQPKLDERLMPLEGQYKTPPKKADPKSSLYLMELEKEMLAVAN